MLKNLILNVFLISFVFAKIEVSTTVDSKEIYNYENINLKIIVNQSDGFPIVEKSLGFEVIYFHVTLHHVLPDCFVVI